MSVAFASARPRGKGEVTQQTIQKVGRGPRAGGGAGYRRARAEPGRGQPAGAGLEQSRGAAEGRDPAGPQEHPAASMRQLGRGPRAGPQGGGAGRHRECVGGVVSAGQAGAVGTRRLWGRGRAAAAGQGRRTVGTGALGMVSAGWGPWGHAGYSVRPRRTWWGPTAFKDPAPRAGCRAAGPNSPGMVSIEWPARDAVRGATLGIALGRARRRGDPPGWRRQWRNAAGGPWPLRTA